jgi:hypothetical protein
MTGRDAVGPQVGVDEQCRVAVTPVSGNLGDRVTGAVVRVAPTAAQWLRFLCIRSAESCVSWLSASPFHRDDRDRHSRAGSESTSAVVPTAKGVRAVTTDNDWREVSRDRAWESSGEREHLRAVLDLVVEMQRRGEHDVEPTLRAINDASVASVPGARYAGVTVVGSNEVTTLAATDPFVRDVDDAQRLAREGPCISATPNHDTILIEDLTTDERWPRFRQLALHRTPMRSVLSFQLFAEEDTAAALTFYAQTAGSFGERSIEVGRVVAAHTAMAWNLMLRENHFRSALADHDVVGQAGAVLMARYDIDATAAFELLKRLARNSPEKLVDVAHRLARDASTE